MNFLDQIVTHKRDEVAKRRAEIKPSSLFSMEYYARKTLSMSSALTGDRSFSIIAEIKRSSPSAGMLKASMSPTTLAADYQRNGAAAISVLTDERFFSGTIRDLENVRHEVSIPILRKEFIIDEYQVAEAKAYGADAVLLIASILERTQLQELSLAAQESDMECLVELHDAAEIEKLDFETMKLLGINNRDLRTFAIDVEKTFLLARHLPGGVTIVSESGISSASQLRRLLGAGIRAALIGEHFMKSDTPGRTLQKLLADLKNETVH